MFKSSTQVKDKIRNLAKKTKGDPQELLQIYMFERLLERISLSPYNRNFILKGGLLLSSLLGVDFRTTRDMDTTIKGMPVTEETMRKTLEEIIKTPVDDNVTFEIEKVSGIREDAAYEDFRFSLIAYQDKMKVRLHVDITTGDVITPREVNYNYQFMFNAQTVNIKAYPIETVLAEKLETVLRRGASNTRARDFYDLYMLFALKKDEVDWECLGQAIAHTSQLRGSEEQIKDYQQILKSLEKDPSLTREWEFYTKKHEYAKEILFKDTVLAATAMMDNIERAGKGNGLDDKIMNARASLNPSIIFTEERADKGKKKNGRG